MSNKFLLPSFLLGSILILLIVVIIGYGVIEVGETLAKNQDKFNWLEEITNSSTMLSECNYELHDLKRIIVSAERILDFVEKHLDDLVIDAAIGTRIMECKIKNFANATALER